MYYVKDGQNKTVLTIGRDEEGPYSARVLAGGQHKSQLKPEKAVRGPSQVGVPSILKDK